MIKFSTAAFGFGLIASSSAFAAEKTVTLAVRYCAACPGTVKKSLLDVPGDTTTLVTAGDKTAVVTFDDSKAEVDALVKATTNAGYPSEPKS